MFFHWLGTKFGDVSTHPSEHLQHDLGRSDGELQCLVQGLFVFCTVGVPGSHGVPSQQSLLFGMPEDVRSNALLTQTAVMEETMREKLTQLQHKIGKHCDSTAAAVKDLVFEFVAARSFPTPCTVRCWHRRPPDRHAGSHSPPTAGF